MKRIMQILVLDKKWRRFIFALKSCLQFPSLYPVRRFPSLNLKACVENYVTNMRMARYYSQLIRAKYLNFLQPFNGFGRSQISTFDIGSLAHLQRRITLDGRNEVDLQREFFDLLWQQVQKEDYVYDLRQIFQDVDGEVYFDHVHCSDIGYDLIAQHIARKVIALETLEIQNKGD